MSKQLISKKQAGFTLIELVVVIIILGIVGAAATARFQDLSGDARSATVTAIAAEISSGSAINYAEGRIDGSYTTAVANGACLGVATGLLQSGALPSGWTVSGTIDDCGAAGNTEIDDCQVENTPGPVTDTATISLICTQ